MNSERCEYPKPVSYGERKPIQPDPNRVPSYIRKDTVPVSKNGSQVVIGGQTRIDINI